MTKTELSIYWDKLKKEWGLIFYDPDKSYPVHLNLETIKEMRRIGDALIVVGDKLKTENKTL